MPRSLRSPRKRVGSVPSARACVPACRIVRAPICARDRVKRDTLLGGLAHERTLGGFGVPNSGAHVTRECDARASGAAGFCTCDRERPHVAVARSTRSARAIAHARRQGEILSLAASHTNEPLAVLAFQILGHRYRASVMPARAAPLGSARAIVSARMWPWRVRRDLRARSRMRGVKERLSPWRPRTRTNPWHPWRSKFWGTRNARAPCRSGAAFRCQQARMPHSRSRGVAQSRSTRARRGVVRISIQCGSGQRRGLLKSKYAWCSTPSGHVYVITSSCPARRGWPFFGLPRPSMHAK